MSHTATAARPTAARTHRPLVEPPVIEGDCPACRGVFELTPTGQVPEHARPDRGQRRRCPCSGWLARNPHPRKYFFVEGVRFL
jgi:hypothetical protein